MTKDKPVKETTKRKRLVGGAGRPGPDAEFIGIYMHKSLKAKAREAAEKDDRSLSNWLERIIKEKLGLVRK